MIAQADSNILNLPLVSFGTFKLKDKAAYDSVLTALNCGYRSIDTARCYNNEKEVGNAIRVSMVPREELFITSKIAPWEVTSTEEAFAAIENSLASLQISYLDLMLIHWPGRAKTAVDSSNNRVARLSAWEALRQAKRAGIVRHIGVSNFTVAHLQELPDVPAVNQVERHPLYRQESLLKYCRDKNVYLQAYSPIGCAAPAILTHPTILAISEEAGCSSVAECLLLWSLQEGVPVVVKSATESRIRSNFEVAFRLLAEEPPRLNTSQMDRLYQINEQIKFCWNPDVVT